MIAIAGALSICAALGLFVAEAMYHPSARTRAGWVLLLVGLALFAVYAISA